MVQNPVSELMSDITVQQVEYVLHIGTEDMYGLYAECSVNTEGLDKIVLGSVILDEKSGEPVVSSGTSFHEYPNGISEDKIEIVSGQGAISFMEEICKREDIYQPFIPRSEIDV